MLIRRAIALASTAGLASSLAAHAQSVPWLAATSGNWNDSTKWTGGNVPDVAGETGVLGLTGAYTVTQNVGGLTLDGIDITNLDAILNLGGRTVNLVGAGIINSGTVAANTGTSTITGPVVNNASGRVTIANATTLNLSADVTNDGLFTINPTAGASATTLRLEGSLAFSGSGALVLNAPGARAQILSPSSAVLTNGTAHTIRGQGQILLPLVNEGLVSADVPSGSLLINSEPKSNSGIMQSAGGTLAITIGITQSSSGRILADGTDVTLSSATITGGAIDSAGAGRVRTIGGTNGFEDVSSEAHVEIANATILELRSDSYTNNGVLDVNPTAGASGTTLRVVGPITVDGIGEVRLNAPGVRAQIAAGTDGFLTLGADQVVRGQGQITVRTENLGTVSADTPGGAITLLGASKVNGGLIEAAGGTIELSSTSVMQSPAGVMLADGSEIRLSASTIVGGTLVSASGGEVRAVGGTSTLDNVDSVASIGIVNAMALTIGGGAFTNDGTILVNTTSGAATTTLRAGDAVVIDGVGEIVLNAPGSRALVAANSGASFTLGAGQVLRGFGQIAAPITNLGLVDADVSGQSLDVLGAAKSNGGTIRASAGGTLALSATEIINIGTGELRADDGLITLSNTTLTDGTYVATDAGVLRTIGGTSTLQDLDLNGPLDIANATAVQIRGGFENNGTILVNTVAGAATTTLRAEGAVSIGGTGQIVLNAPGVRAQITEGFGGSLALGPGQTLRGIGQLALPMTIEGTVAPGLSIGSLNVSTTGFTLTWQPTSTLDVELGSLASFDKIAGGNHTINGGTVNVTLTDDYAPALFDTHAVIDGIVGSAISGAFDGVTGPALPSPWIWRVGVLGNDVVVGVSCPSDVNNDFTVDILDFLDFLDAFGNCENQPAPCGTAVSADYNGDTFVDILDFLDFLDAFGGGC